MTDPLPPLPPKSERGETWGWSEYDLRDYATAAIEPWRAKLAEQCGKTLAAQAQRDELRGLLEEAEKKLAAERVPDKDLPLKLWYMRDNHTFASLPLDPELAADKIATLLKEGDGRCGMLCSKQFDEHVHHDFNSPDKKFIAQTKQWVQDALAAEALRKPQLLERIRAALSRCAT